jgi:aspartate racemase
MLCSERLTMKTIGLIGGMSWESTVPYYRQLNEAVKQQLGGLHSAKCILYSVDFYEIERLQHAGDWSGAGAILADAACRLERAGADFIVLCTNTMHKVASSIESAVSIPLLHIADATAAAIKQAGVHRVGLLGTKFTMQQPFYRERLSRQHGIEVLLPNDAEQDSLHQIIYQELCQGVINPESKQAVRKMMAGLAWQGVEGIILGCTEIGLLISKADAAVPLFDTTIIHAQAAVELALQDRSHSRN